MLSLALAGMLVLDVVELPDGGRLVGQIVKAEPLELVTPTGRFRFVPEELARVRKRAELVQVFRETRARGGEDVRARQVLAEWCLGNGLYPELFDLIDSLLGQESTRARGEELVARALTESVLDGVSPAEDPDSEGVERLVAHAVGESPSRALVARDWLSAVEPALRVAAVEKKMQGSSTARRKDCVEILGGLAHDEDALESLIERSLFDRSEQVRETARGHVLQSAHPNLVIPYKEALSSDRAEVRMAAYPVLESLADPRAVSSLIRLLKRQSHGSSAPRNHIFIGEQRTYVGDFEVEIAQGAVIAKPVIGVLQTGHLLDVRVHGVSGTTVIERRIIRRVLNRTTGVDFGEDFHAWTAWWNDHGKQVIENHFAGSEAGS